MAQVLMRQQILMLQMVGYYVFKIGQEIIMMTLETYHQEHLMLATYLYMEI